MIPLIRGFKDILPDETPIWAHIERTASELFQSFGFREIRLPIMEKTALFQRSIGEHTDIVEKEMYTLTTGGGEPITLRPEATASVVRSYIQQQLYAKDPIQKLYTIGPMFRRERPQKGRYRQFYQISAEAFGIEAPYVDAQMVVMAWDLFERLGVEGLSVHLNSLGCPACRPAFKQALSDLLSAGTDGLCGDCLRRKDKNPLRVLDCKVTGCRETLKNAPAMTDYLCNDCARHFAAVQDALNQAHIPYLINPRLVRGLDYYTRTAFEIQADDFGAQNAIAGGGRYDGLVQALEGPSQPAVGFAIGLDRLVELTLRRPTAPLSGPVVYLAVLGEELQARAFEWSCALIRAGIPAEADFSGKSLKALMKRADRLNAAHVLIAGSQELSAGALILRNMRTKEQIPVPLDHLVASIERYLKETHP